MTELELEKIWQILVDKFDEPCNWSEIEEYMVSEWCGDNLVDLIIQFVGLDF